MLGEVKIVDYRCQNIATKQIFTVFQYWQYDLSIGRPHQTPRLVRGVQPTQDNCPVEVQRSSSWLLLVHLIFEVMDWPGIKDFILRRITGQFVPQSGTKCPYIVPIGESELVD